MFGASHEEFSPDELLRHAVAAGFDGISAADHRRPWWEPGESGHAWVWLGAAGQATSGSRSARALPRAAPATGRR